MSTLQILRDGLIEFGIPVKQVILRESVEIIDGVEQLVTMLSFSFIENNELAAIKL